MSRPGALQRLRCRATRRRMQRFLDADPSALLSADEAQRVRAHLAQCGCCQGLAHQYEELGRLLAAQGVTAEPAEQDVERLRATAQAQIWGGDRD